MTVSYINLMKAQQKRHMMPVSIAPMSQSQMVDAGRAARARLMGSQPAVRRLVVPMPVQEPVEPEEVVSMDDDGVPHFAPINMLSLPSCRFLTTVVALQTGVPEQTLLGVGKLRHIVEARDKLIKLIFEHTQHSLPMIGKVVRRDHTTVLHSLRKSGCYYRLVDIAPTTDPRSRGAGVSQGKRDVILIRPSAAFSSTSLPKAEDIIDQVCQKYGLTPADLQSSRRGRSLGHARQEAIYRIWNETKLSQPEIGRILGNRDHSAVSYSVKAYEARMASEKPAGRAAA